jgi:hypothetical protein
MMMASGGNGVVSIISFPDEHMEETTLAGEGMKQLVGATESVGLLVGDELGASLGLPVGLSEGDALGLEVGLPVGPSEGDALGLAVDRLGLPEGESLGETDGEVVGRALGEELFVGLSDGALLGK